MKVDYDKKGDVLYVMLREAENVVNVDTGDDVLVRKDADTGEVIGYTILNFSERSDEESVVVEVQDSRVEEVQETVEA